VPAEQPRRLGVGFGIGVGVFLVVGCAASLFLMLPLAMSSDPCGQGDEAFRCSSTGQALLPLLPWLALLAGLIGIGVGVALVRRWRDAPASGLVSAFVIYVVTVCVAVSYAGRSDDTPQPPSRQQIAADYATLRQRPDGDAMLGRYQALFTGLQDQFADDVQWDATNREGPLGCDRDFPAIESINTDDVQKWTLSAYLSYAPDPAGVRQSTTTLAGYLARHGFALAPEKTNPINGAAVDATYRDGYGTVVAVTAAPLFTIDLATGCFLTPAAKQRGTPPTGP
jgi:hypothetical protein